MITVVLSTSIRADRARVWRALTDPAEVVGWDAAIVAPLDAPPDYPKPGQHVRWRYRMGKIPLVLHDCPKEVVVGERLRSSIALGPLRFDETYTLAPDPKDSACSLLSMRLSASNVVPLVGGILDRIAVTRLTTRLADTTLRSLRRWCELTRVSQPRHSPSRWRAIGRDPHRGY